MRQVGLGNVELFPRREMLDLVKVGGQARGIITRNLLTGEMERHAADAVLLCTGGYGRVFFLSTNAVNCNATAAWRCHKQGALFANPCFTQIHPTCIPVAGEHQSKLTLMSESLRNDGRVWVPSKKGDTRRPGDIPESERDYYLERRYPAFGNLVPRDVASRAAKLACDQGFGVGSTGLAVYLDFDEAIGRMGRGAVSEKYGNLFDMYERITGDSPYETAMRIYPASHYTMGGLWVDYNLMTTVPGLFALGEANFSDHGANRLGASALMQGLADGYFVIPYTVGNYLWSTDLGQGVTTDHDAFGAAEEEARVRLNKLLNIGGKRSVLDFHRQLGKVVWDKVGMGRNEKGLGEALTEIPKIREEFWENVSVPGEASTLNSSLAEANRVADFLEISELMARDALGRNESCGGHFREESQTPDGEALRNDDDYSYSAAWEFQGLDKEHTLHKEALEFEYVKLTQRSYK
jgi:succinate dehydrogenase / fumarate reductase flavoprotein subunit